MACRVEIARTEDVDDSGRQEIVDLCTEAFARSYDALFGFLGPRSIHVLGRDEEGGLVAHAVITERPFRTNGLRLRGAYFDAVAARPGAQGRGYGSRVVSEATRAAAERFDVAALCTFIPSWYERLGWEAWQGPLALDKEGTIIPTVEEMGVVMFHRFPHTPPLDPQQTLIASWRPGGGW